MDSIIKEQVLRYILYMFTSEKQLLNTYLTKQLITKFNLSRFQVYRLIKRLEQEQVIRINRISKHLSEIQLINAHRLIDLISATHARNQRTSQQTPEHEPSKKELLRHARQLLKHNYKRQSSIHRKATEKYSLKAVLSEEEQLELLADFELWLMDVSDRVLLFRDVNEELQILPYQTRFNSRLKALEIVKNAEKTFQIAKQRYINAVFLTLTLPPIFPQRLALWALSYLLHRIKAYLRRKSKETIPHFRVDEPQTSFNPHSHIIIFSIDWIMEKEQFTQYLEKHLTEFLQNLGHHYKKTINNRATDYDILALNELGQLFIKKYNKYKRQHAKYTGPVNWLTRIKLESNDYVFENPPPDAHKLKSSKATAYDGGKVSVFDYIKYYIISNLIEATQIEENGVSKADKPALVWYWLNRRPFYFASPKIRPLKIKKPPSGWQFIGSFYVHNDTFIYELLMTSQHRAHA